MLLVQVTLLMKNSVEMFSCGIRLDPIGRRAIG